MKKIQSLFDAFRALFHRGNEPHRVCWKCKKLIKRREKYRHIKIGWFAPVFTVEHRDCKNPTLIPPVDPGPSLPFDGTPAEIMGLEPTTWPVYGGIDRTRLTPPESVETLP